MLGRREKRKKKLRDYRYVRRERKEKIREKGME